MIFPDFLQIREIGDDCGLLVAERQINEIPDAGNIQFVRHSKKLVVLALAKAVHMFGKTVQLVHIDHRALQSSEGGVIALQHGDVTVLTKHIPDSQPV